MRPQLSVLIKAQAGLWTLQEQSWAIILTLLLFSISRTIKRVLQMKDALFSVFSDHLRAQQWNSCNDHRKKREAITRANLCKKLILVVWTNNNPIGWLGSEVTRLLCNVGWDLERTWYMRLWHCCITSQIDYQRQSYTQVRGKRQRRDKYNCTDRVLKGLIILFRNLTLIFSTHLK